MKFLGSDLSCHCTVNNYVGNALTKKIYYNRKYRITQNVYLRTNEDNNCLFRT